MEFREDPTTYSVGGKESRWETGLGRYAQRFTEWIVAGPQTQPPDIQVALLQHSLTKRNTLIVVIFTMLMLACVAIVITGKIWAWAWLFAEIVLGLVRIWLQVAFERAKSSGRTGDAVVPIFAGLVWGAVLAVAGYQSVMSGEWILILLLGICLAGVVGGISSRNAGTPRYAVVLMCLLALPFTIATLISPIPRLFFVGLQIPLYMAGVILVLFENYNVLLGLYRAERENNWLAHHDLLTGLPNRMMKLKRFDELLSEPGSLRSAKQPIFTVFWLDLDGFKEVNDNYGHATGDAVLVAAANRLRDCIREVDFLCRIGGDEFVILLPSISPPEAATMARRIIGRVSEPFMIGGTSLQVAISVGSACAPQQGITADALLRSADKAMYEAKRLRIGYLTATSAVPAEIVELVPATDANTRMANAAAAPEIGQLPLPLPAKSL